MSEADERGCPVGNPWQTIDLRTYEEHMASDNVRQLQTLNDITRQQLNDYLPFSMAILGVGAGNGLEHIDTATTRKVYGIDVNDLYLHTCKERYPQLTGVLELICCDLSESSVVLPPSDLLICNLIVEYLGKQKFIDIILSNKQNVKIISCVIQRNNDQYFVSDSGSASAFQPIVSIHHDIDPQSLLDGFSEIDFVCVRKTFYPLPNGKELARIDLRTRVQQINR